MLVLENAVRFDDRGMREGLESPRLVPEAIVRGIGNLEAHLVPRDGVSGAVYGVPALVEELGVEVVVNAEHL
jgi:hypothetical protein